MIYGLLDVFLREAGSLLCRALREVLSDDGLNCLGALGSTFTVNLMSVSKVLFTPTPVAILRD
jgi:hypothetical protein